MPAIDIAILLKAYRLMCTANAMAAIYEANRSICKYVHSTSRGHEAVQLALAFQLLPADYVSPYYRDESLLLGMGYQPYELMLQLLAKKDDPFSGGRSYYSHPNSIAEDKPKMIHQSSATGMQAIPATGIAQGLQYLQKINSPLFKVNNDGSLPIVVCSLGDASITEGEVSEAFQFAVLKKLPIIYLVQDNSWGISATAEETRAMDSYDYAAGFKGMQRIHINGTDFEECYEQLQQVIANTRQQRQPCLVHAKLSLLGHHTSGVRKEFYRTREELSEQGINDPLPKLKKRLAETGIALETLTQIENEAIDLVKTDFLRATNAIEPNPASVEDFVFVPTPIVEEKGERSPENAAPVIMIDAALHAIREIMEKHPEAILYGQDAGRRLGGVFRETATLAAQFGDHRVFNTAIQEAYIIGSTAGMSAVGAKPIVEIQFADYVYPGFNQLVTEVAKSCYLSMGKFPVQALIRIPIGAYGGGGPYHSASIETTLLSIKGIKIAYPSNAADMKGLMKAAFYDPNPVIMLEHKGLYWAKLPGTSSSKTIEPSADYIIPLGKAKKVIEADADKIANGDTCCIITYGMGVYWAVEAASHFTGQVTIVDLRSLFPLDEALIFETVKMHGRCLVLTEEQQDNSFAEALAGKISQHCFRYLDQPVTVIGSLNTPVVPLNIHLEKAMLPTVEKIKQQLESLLTE
ncbi:MAG: thiamine pyrophosphate-dependent enzyme [Chitinophagaceae bacterium]